MKFRESGMPDEQMWDTFFTPMQTLYQLDINEDIKTLIDIGCGYGTFLIPASGLVKHKVIGIDIENEMIETCREKIQEQGIKNIELLHGDISTEQTIKDLEKHKGDIDYICLFNILHCEQPLNLLNAAYRILNNNGKIGVIHWKYENTPRGPSMEIRPTPEIINGWALKAGFVLEKFVELPPYHYGLVFTKNYKGEIV
ncbi:class I SAM-dependent methyltransferase [Petroclostridium sp. X23]|uniref:class I SAM-dependent methyltransferase n=1 Tax=Petroclostridium sp. X23 TaxID=3045146 RepID=UPI0024AD88E4|nr:class I SAM-dependent methyltransferase [Petroclostridium sp. X23]WHH60008.1 class I SAM-dependent methyltransferase [Petroclostridium sp. X23]